MGKENTEWYKEVWDCICRINKKEFTLHEVYKYEEELSKKYPNNNDIKAKIRQQLQYLRDEGKIIFIDNDGNYSLA